MFTKHLLAASIVMVMVLPMTSEAKTIEPKAEVVSKSKTSTVSMTGSDLVPLTLVDIDNKGSDIGKVVKLAATTPNTLDLWIAKLSYCESNDKWTAVNAMDTDGTPSYGRFQFKIGTWKGYIKKYDLFGWETWTEQDYWDTIYDGDKQEIVLRHMIKDPAVRLRNEFPACTRKLGLPPMQTALK